MSMALRRVISAAAPAGEVHQQDAAGIGAVHDEMGDAVRERVGLAGPGAGNDEERPAWDGVLLADGVLDSAAPG